MEEYLKQMIAKEQEALGRVSESDVEVRKAIQRRLESFQKNLGDMKGPNKFGISRT